MYIRYHDNWFWQIAIVVVLIVLLFGRGKISDLMGDVAKEKSFKKGISDNTETSNKDSEDKIILTVTKCHRLVGLNYSS